MFSLCFCIVFSSVLCCCCFVLLFPSFLTSVTFSVVFLSFPFFLSSFLPFFLSSFLFSFFFLPFSQFHGDDLSKVMTFPDAKNTTFRISGVQFPLPTSGATNEFQISFVGRDFEKSTYFCVDIFYNLHTGVVKMMNKEAPTTMKQEEAKEVHYPVYCKANGFCHVPPQPTSCTDDAECRTPWYRSSYCQSGGTCHLELPPKCKTDSDCNPKKVSVLLMAALNKQATKKNTEAPLLGSCKTDADCPSSCKWKSSCLIHT